MGEWRDDMLAIVECGLCDDRGIRNGMHQCDHIDYGAIAKRGLAKVKAALEEAKKC